MLKLDTQYQNREASFIKGFELSCQIFGKAIEKDRLPSRYSHVAIGVDHIIYGVAFRTIIGTPYQFIYHLAKAGLIALTNEKSERKSQLIRFHIVSAIFNPILELSLNVVTSSIRITTLALGILYPKISAYGWLLAAKIDLAQQKALAAFSTFFVSDLPFNTDDAEEMSIGIGSATTGYLGEEVCHELFKEIYSLDSSNIDSEGNPSYGKVFFPKETLITTGEAYDESQQKITPAPQATGHS